MAKSKPASTTLEAELADLVTTRTDLQARRAALAVEVEQAVAARGELLIQGGDAATIGDAERACREIEGTSFGVADALVEIERRIVATEARIAEGHAIAERENAAASLEGCLDLLGPSSSFVSTLAALRTDTTCHARASGS